MINFSGSGPIKEKKTDDKNKMFYLKILGAFLVVYTLDALIIQSSINNSEFGVRIIQTVMNNLTIIASPMDLLFYIVSINPLVFSLKVEMFTLIDMQIFFISMNYS